MVTDFNGYKVEPIPLNFAFEPVAYLAMRTRM